MAPPSMWQALEFVHMIGQNLSIGALGISWSFSHQSILSVFGCQQNIYAGSQRLIRLIGGKLSIQMNMHWS
jgi:hypothetical protein